MTRPIIAPIVTIVVGATTGAYYLQHVDRDTPRVATAAISRGDVVQQVSATGTLEARQTVLVGTQVSGRVVELHADFNTIVHKGQLLARLDPSLLETAVAQARANLSASQAEAERLEVAVADAILQTGRTRELADRALVPEADREAAEATLRGLEAQVRSARAQVAQAEAALEQRQVDLAHASIYSPIDGIVISRDVDVGQTVAASMEAPTLFTLAADLTRMLVNASIDEADLGQVAEGLRVRFTVDAYPGRSFAGAVSQVRLQPVVSQGVVSYTAVIDVANLELLLKPGMTATVAIEVARRDDVLRVPAAALRFRPADDVLTALGRSNVPATTANVARVWRWVNGVLDPVDVEVGLSDGTYTELIAGSLAPGTELVTSVALGAQASSGSVPSNGQSPLLAGPQGMPPPPLLGTPPPG